MEENQNEFEQKEATVNEGEVVTEVHASSEYTDEEKESGKTMAILAYLLPPIPYFIEKDNKWVRFHAVQGMNLFILGLIAGMLSLFTFSILSTLVNLVQLGLFIIAIMGIINVCHGEAKELFLVDKIKFIKE